MLLRTVGLGLLALGIAGCQSKPPLMHEFTTLEIYQRFFEQAVNWSSKGPKTVRIGTMNGEQSAVEQSIQEGLGLTDDQAKSLQTVAAEHLKQLTEFDKTAKPLVWEHRMRVLEGDEEARVWLDNLAARRDQLIVNAINRLRDAVGEERFRALDTMVQSKKTGGSFLELKVN